MKQQYEEWIKQNPGQSAESMQAAFPELKLVRGHYYDWQFGPQAHTWLENERDIVDPTQHNIGHYEPLTLQTIGRKVTGQCGVCGEWVFDGKRFCSNECEERFVND